MILSSNQIITLLHHLILAICQAIIAVIKERTKDIEVTLGKVLTFILLLPVIPGNLA